MKQDDSSGSSSPRNIVGGDDVSSNNNYNNKDGASKVYGSENNVSYTSTREHFLYADYTPLEDDRNLVEMLKNFVSLIAQVIKRSETDAKCMSLLSSSDLLRKEVISIIRNARITAIDKIDQFYKRNSDIFSSVPDLQPASGNTSLADAKTLLDKMLADVEMNSSRQQEKYQENIMSMINTNRIVLIDALLNWLSDEKHDFPWPVLANLSIELEAYINPMTNNNSYRVTRSASTTAATDGSASKNIEERKKGTEKFVISSIAPPQFSYRIEFDSAGVEFWNFRKKVVDLGVKELMLPTGMRLPISEKVKSTFRLSPRKEEQTKEPHFTRVDDFYLHSLALKSSNLLEVQLTSDFAGPAMENKGEVFTLIYDVTNLKDSSIHATQSFNTDLGLFATRPRVHYMGSRGNREEEQQGTMTEMDLLQIKEIERAADLSKLATFGTAVLTRAQILWNPDILALKGKLKQLMVDEKKVIDISSKDGAAVEVASSKGTAAAPSDLVSVDFRLLFDLLETLARSFSPVAGKLKEKTPVKGELILRQELKGEQRKEFAVRLDELRSELGETSFGKSVFQIILGA
jgi:hypothetical protein